MKFWEGARCNHPLKLSQLFPNTIGIRGFSKRTKGTPSELRLLRNKEIMEETKWQLLAVRNEKEELSGKLAAKDVEWSDVRSRVAEATCPKLADVTSENT
jgi:hypothetical protein